MGIDSASDPDQEYIYFMGSERIAFQLKFLFYHQNCRSHSFGRFVGVRVSAETNFRCVRSSGICTPILALRKKLRNLHAKSQ